MAGNNLIYPVQGDPLTRLAPDVYVAFGPAKGPRGSYRVWEEGGVYPQVVFEVWSPGNRAGEMALKRAAYDRFGVEEYYLVFPEFPMRLEGWRRAAAGAFERVPEMDGHVSPRLGVRFDLAGGELTLCGPDGRAWVLPDETERQRAEAVQEREQADRERAAEAARRVESERRASALAAKLRELGIDPDAVG